MYCIRCGAAIPGPETGQNQVRCGLCGYVRYGQPSPCVSVLIPSEGRVLLGLRREGGSIRPGTWCLPCGHIELGEHYLEAARREVYEETHLEIRPVSILNVVANHFPRDVHSLVVVVLALPVTSDLRAGDDLSRAGWFPLEGPFPDMAFQADIEIIRRYRRYGGALGIPLEDNKNSFYER